MSIRRTHRNANCLGLCFLVLSLFSLHISPQASVPVTSHAVTHAVTYQVRASGKVLPLAPLPHGH